MDLMDSPEVGTASQPCRPPGGRFQRGSSLCSPTEAAMVLLQVKILGPRDPLQRKCGNREPLLTSAHVS